MIFPMPKGRRNFGTTRFILVIKRPLPSAGRGG